MDTDTDMDTDTNTDTDTDNHQRARSPDTGVHLALARSAFASFQPRLPSNPAVARYGAAPVVDLDALPPTPRRVVNKTPMASSFLSFNTPARAADSCDSSISSIPDLDRSYDASMEVSFAAAAAAPPPSTGKKRRKRKAVASRFRSASRKQAARKASPRAGQPRSSVKKSRRKQATKPVSRPAPAALPVASSPTRHTPSGLRVMRRPAAAETPADRAAALAAFRAARSTSRKAKPVASRFRNSTKRSAAAAPAAPAPAAPATPSMAATKRVLNFASTGKRRAAPKSAARQDAARARPTPQSSIRNEAARNRASRVGATAKRELDLLASTELHWHFVLAKLEAARRVQQVEAFETVVALQAALDRARELAAARRAALSQLAALDRVQNVVAAARGPALAVSRKLPALEAAYSEIGTAIAHTTAHMPLEQVAVDEASLSRALGDARHELDVVVRGLAPAAPIARSVATSLEKLAGATTSELAALAQSLRVLRQAQTLHSREASLAVHVADMMATV
ncbi:uncharacterized protein AMSG_10124 [Thecamonas trahens ATCC 50062]|uniref:Uncharacterized protein n=1 Tax=Thecamonas trahens ATCC 50062 TaxID=461836 RepID=A0A0L0DQV3_THETB|nr:hypothetical protein AMSG_10124 [Thecamonas trahens ATCC 50062]KNC54401.1 hypothetical protein AMSG_10124 [Thecamonas trahens ATCC 50062]|eukprot:XP_013753699.1 hypothetical protein AMSG_10124 [Thecamonas trahens ATCC 50062]